jgi:outer membrane protein assembly factor BamB
MLAVACSDGEDSTRPSSVVATNPEASAAAAPPASVAAAPLRTCPATYPGIVALDGRSGEFIWNHCGAEDAGLRVLGAHDGLVYVATTFMPGPSDPGTAVVALDAGSETPRFELTIPTMNESYHLDALFVGGPFAANGVIVLSILEGPTIFTVGYDATNGAELWRTSEVEGFVAANADGVVVVAEPAIFDTNVPETHRMIWALDRLTGEILWELDDPGAVGISIAEALLVLTRVGRDQQPAPTHVVDALGGTQLWESDGVRGYVVHAGTALVGFEHRSPEEVTVGSVDATSGAPLWSQSAAADGGFPTPVGLVVAAPLAGGDGQVYIRKDAGLVALDAVTGDELWSGGAEAAPIVTTPNGLLALTADELQLLAPADGTPVWSAKLGVTSRVSNVFTDGTTIYVSWN